MPSKKKINPRKKVVSKSATTKAKKQNPLPKPKPKAAVLKKSPPKKLTGKEMSALMWKKIKMEKIPDLGSFDFLETYIDFPTFLRMMNVCRNTAISWINMGWIKCTRLRKLRYFSKHDIREMMDRFSNTGTMVYLYFIHLQELLPEAI